jgi:hypothetical protein
MIKNYREEKVKLIPGDTLEIEGKKRTIVSWIVYERMKFLNFLRDNRNYTLSPSVQAMIKENNADTERKNSTGSSK